MCTAGCAHGKEAQPTCEEGQAMRGAVVELVAEQQQAAEQDDGEGDGRPQPPVPPQLRHHALPCSWGPAGSRPLCGQVGALLIPACGTVTMFTKKSAYQSLGLMMRGTCNMQQSVLWTGMTQQVEGL